MGVLAGPGAMPAVESAEYLLKVRDSLRHSDWVKSLNYGGTTVPWWRC